MRSGSRSTFSNMPDCSRSFTPISPRQIGAREALLNLPADFAGLALMCLRLLAFSARRMQPGECEFDIQLQPHTSHVPREDGRTRELSLRFGMGGLREKCLAEPAPGAGFDFAQA